MRAGYEGNGTWFTGESYIFFPVPISEGTVPLALACTYTAGERASSKLFIHFILLGKFATVHGTLRHRQQRKWNLVLAVRICSVGIEGGIYANRLMFYTAVCSNGGFVTALWRLWLDFTIEASTLTDHTYCLCILYVITWEYCQSGRRSADPAKNK